MHFEEVRRRLILATSTFVEHHHYLLTISAHERTMTAHLSNYVKSEFPEWDVDCEFDMNGRVRKRLRWPNTDDREKLVIPDIIVHHEGTSENLLAIEAKKAGRNNADDRAKLMRFMAAPEYGYQNAALVTFVTGRHFAIETEFLANARPY